MSFPPSPIAAVMFSDDASLIILEQFESRSRGFFLNDFTLFEGGTLLYWQRYDMVRDMVQKVSEFCKPSFLEQIKTSKWTCIEWSQELEFGL